MDKIIILNSFLVAVSLFYTQIYLTSLPSISNDFSISYSIVQLIFIGNILFFGLSQLFYGPLSEHYGRKNCLLFGLFVALVGTLLNFFSINIIMFIAGQLLIGLGAGSCSVIPRVISKEIYQDADLIKAISYMSAGSTIAAGVAPILGSSLQADLGWRYVFLILFFFTIIALILVKFNISKTQNRVNINLKFRIVKDYGNLFINKLFLSYALLNSCLYSIIIIYLSMSPFLIQSNLHFSSGANGIIYLICSISYLMGNILIVRLVRRININTSVFIGLFVVAVGCLFIIIPIFTQSITLIEIAFCGLLIHFGSGFITPITYKKILCIPNFFSGLSSGAINATRVLVAFIFSLIGALCSIQNLIYLSYLIGLLFLGCLGIFFSIIKMDAMTEKQLL